MEFNNNQNNLEKKFSTNFRWNLVGSSIYEILKIAHQIFLLKVLEPSFYGLMGSIFSIIYLTVYLSEFGLGATLPPFLNIFIESKQNFKNIFLKKYFLPQLLIIFSAAILATYFYSKSFLNSLHAPFLFLIPSVILSESIRIFFRRFLHTVFESKKAVLSEMILMPIYLLAVWIPYLFLNFRMALNLVFIPYLFDSILGITFFIVLINRFFKSLPEIPQTTIQNLWKRIFKARFFNYSASASKELFKGNFLTPFFAYQFGLKDAGIFNLANHIAESIKAIMKATIIFSGNALLAQIKTAGLKVKQRAFKLLYKKLNIVIYPLAIFIAMNYKLLFKSSEATSLTQSTTAMALLFLFISFMEYFFVIYDQFYIVEEQSFKLFLFKILELTLYYIFIIANTFSSPFLTLLAIVAVRLLSFAIISTNAYFLWKIKPNFSIPYKYLILYTIFSSIFYLIFA